MTLIRGKNNSVEKRGKSYPIATAELSCGRRKEENGEKENLESKPEAMNGNFFFLFFRGCRLVVVYIEVKPCLGFEEIRGSFHDLPVNLPVTVGFL